MVRGPRGANILKLVPAMLLLGIAMGNVTVGYSSHDEDTANSSSWWFEGGSGLGVDAEQAGTEQAQLRVGSFRWG